MLTAAILAFPAVSWSQEATPDIRQLFEGTFTTTISKSEANRQVKEQIDDTVDELNFVLRPFARMRLKEATKQCEDIKIDFRGPELSIQCDDRPAAVAPVTGEQGLYVNEEEHRFALVYKLGQRQILQVFADRDGQRKNLYSLSPDGRVLTIETTIESDRLPKPLEYTRTYEKRG